MRNDITALVAQLLAKNGINRAVEPSADLVSQGVTSVDMVHLMLAIEAAFDLTIPDSGLTPANFRSVISIEAMLMTLRAAETTP